MIPFNAHLTVVGLINDDLEEEGERGVGGASGEDSESGEGEEREAEVEGEKKKKRKRKGATHLNLI